MPIKYALLFLIGLIFTEFRIYKNLTEFNKKSQPFVLIVQPIIVRSDKGTEPASMALPIDLVNRAYEKAGVDFHFLEPIFFDNTNARDGKINLDSIVKISRRAGIIRGQNDIVNMFFVNAVDGRKGPLGRGMMGGDLTFIALGDSNSIKENIKYMQAFVISHEVGHNLLLQHAVDDPNVPDSIPNIQGDGAFQDRIDPKYSLNDYQIDIIHKSPLVHSRVDFLSKKIGQEAILDESFEPYFSQLQLREISAFTKKKIPNNQIDSARNFAKKEFISAVTEFNENEKKCINYVVTEINKTLLDNGNTIMANHPWRFIKIEDWLCGGFAHTRGMYIILSQRHIDRYCKNWSDNMTENEKQEVVKKFGSLLVHEQMHSLQRSYKTKFLNLYTKYWHFVNAKVQPEATIDINQVSNPDAPVAEWLIPNTKKANSFYWVRTILKEGSEIPIMGQDFKDVVYNVTKTSNGCHVNKDRLGNLENGSLENFITYTTSFPVKDGLDHPNEISAYMFSEYFKSLLNKTIAFEKTIPESSNNANSFIKWI